MNGGNDRTTDRFGQFPSSSFIVHRSSFSGLCAASGAVKQHPHGEVVCEVLEAVRFAGGGKQEVARLELLPRAFADILSAAPDDDIHFVAGVRLLRIDAVRRVDFELQAAVSKQGYKTLAALAGQSGQRLLKPNLSPAL